MKINVYGSDKVKEEVGQHLSKSKAFLQHPDYPRAGTKYANPHVLALPDLALPSVIIQRENVDEHLHKGGIGDNFQQAVADVYATLKRGTHLKRLEGDHRLKTALLPHQKEGLDFMMQRETGPVLQEFSLWRSVESNGRQCFRHTITKDELPSQPVETGGGVLADEMGMGKSLSMLSLIARTLGGAHDWADEQEPSSSEDRSAKQRSRATLVVVSSGCEYTIFEPTMSTSANANSKSSAFE